MPFGPAFACLDVDLQFAREKLEGIFAGEGDRAKCGTRQDLAIRAVADHNLLRVNLGRIGDVPAVAASIDLHTGFLPANSHRGKAMSDDNDRLAGTRKLIPRDGRYCIAGRESRRSADRPINAARGWRRVQFPGLQLNTGANGRWSRVRGGWKPHPRPPGPRLWLGPPLRQGQRALPALRFRAVRRFLQSPDNQARYCSSLTFSIQSTTLPSSAS